MKKVFIMLFIVSAFIFGLYFKEASVPGQKPLKSAPVRHTDSIVNMRDIKFKKSGYELKATDESFKIDKETAMKLARSYVGMDTSREAEAVRTIKGRLTNRKMPYIAGSKVVLNNYPVWIVTFHKVTLITHGGPAPGSNHKDTIQADQNIVVDAESGEVLMSIAYSI